MAANPGPLKYEVIPFLHKRPRNTGVSVGSVAGFAASFRDGFPNADMMPMCFLQTSKDKPLPNKIYWAESKNSLRTAQLCEASDITGKCPYAQNVNHRHVSYVLRVCRDKASFCSKMLVEAYSSQDLKSFPLAIFALFFFQPSTDVRETNVEELRSIALLVFFAWVYAIKMAMRLS